MSYKSAIALKTGNSPKTTKNDTIWHKKIRLLSEADQVLCKLN